MANIKNRKSTMDQKKINENLEEVFEMKPVTEKVSKKPRYKTKSSTRGGKRPNSGRPKGSTNKITLDLLIKSIDAELGGAYEERLAKNYSEAIAREDWATVKEYDKIFLAKIVADKTETDITSNGETLGLSINFNPTEIDDWKK